ncbi:MAG: CehA/McbA family metallohydrolase, partial [Chitinophagales bacterium]
MKKISFTCILLVAVWSASLKAQHESHHQAASSPLPIYTNVEAQPLAAQVLRLEEALNFLGSSLSTEDAEKLKAMTSMTKGPDIVKAIQAILDPYCLAMVDINPESRVKVVRGPAAARLNQAGWSSFLVKIHNDAGVTARLEVESSNAAPLLHISSFGPRMKPENALTQGQVENRFLELSIYRNRPMLENLSGLNLEYSILQIYSKDAGQREADLSFNVGQGSQDIGFRNAISILFNIRPSTKVILKVKDDGGAPTIASFLITDGIEHILEDTVKDIGKVDYRVRKAQQEFLPFFGEQKIWIPSKELKGVYPLPSRRAAAYDEYPDFFFQPQIYRSDGEHVQLPAGKYKVVFTRGPEYIPQTREIMVSAGKDSMVLSFQLKRWINMANLGWYSADHHVHAAGCSHYESPEEGVPPIDMWRQTVGEDLNVAAVLTWGPSWYHQKTFFTGNVDPLSNKEHLMRYDVEVSGFPSSHAGHIVLLRLKEDDYPGTSTIEEWPSWTLPILKWAKSQQGVVGYAHSGWGLEPISETKDLP